MKYRGITHSLAHSLHPSTTSFHCPVPLPAPEDRASILRAVCRTVAIDHDSVDIEVRRRDETRGRGQAAGG